MNKLFSPASPTMPRPDFGITSKGYQPHIDGLRAVAVMLVILFHIDPAWMPGGYIGVDVFFVISGYLITRLILAEVQTSGRFDFVHFYVRRARRLFPALFATVAITIVIAVALFPATLGGAALIEAIYTMTSASNIFYWSQSGYFDAASITKPLLHTWSLAVEEQFYLVTPAILVFCALRGVRFLAISLVVLAIGSVLANILLVEMGRQTVAFYWMPFRAFEFAIGAGAIWLERRQLPPIWRESLFATALAALIGVAVAFNEQTSFPGYNALLPAVLSAVILVTGRSSRIAGPLLGNPIANWIGRISYSAYLVHWPLLVFLFAWASSLPEWPVGILALAATLVIAWAMYEFVEQPFRRPQPEDRVVGKFTTGALLIICATITTATASMAYTRSTTPGLAIDHDAIIKADQHRTWINLRRLQGDWAAGTERKIFLVGDSQGADLVNLLLAYEPALETSLRTFASDKFCQVKFSPEFYTSGDYGDEYKPPFNQVQLCEDDIARFTADPRLAEADTIILAFAWYATSPRYLPGDVSAIRAINPDAAIFVAGPKDVPLSSIDYARRGVEPDEAAALARQDTDAKVLQTIDRLASLQDAKLLDLYRVSCDDSSCDMFMETGYPIFFDPRHYTILGASYIARGLRFWEYVAEPLSLNQLQ